MMCVGVSTLPPMARSPSETPLQVLRADASWLQVPENEEHGAQTAVKQAAHRRLDVGVGDAVSYSASEQVFKGAHMRLDVAVGAVVSYSSSKQVVKEAHMRLDVAVGAVIS